PCGFDKLAHILPMSCIKVFRRFCRGVVPRKSRITKYNRLREVDFLSLRNNWRLTSKTVFSNPILAPWYNPTWCSQMLTINTSLVAKANSELLRSKSWSSPRSRPSVPSTSMTRILSAISVADDLFLANHIPLVVCRLSASDMTEKSVLKRAFRRVDLPVDCEPKTEMR